MRRRVEEALDLLDIERLRARSVQTLSGGERQRVAIAAALTPGARVLLLDEPTSQLDPQGAEDVLAALKRLVDDLGVTVVAAEHRLERVAGFADLALGCRGDGGVIVGSPGEVFDALESGPPVARLGRVAGWSPTPLSVRSARRFVPSFSVPPVVAAVVPPVGSVLVAARGITAGYGGEAVLRDVELSVSTGEVVALIGRNGAGKTTLLRCLAGVHAPMRGEVTGPGGPPRPGHDVALCPQAPDAILFKDTVAGEVLATLDAHGGGSPEEILDLVGLSTLADAHPRDLSAGERLLVAIAATVATKAPVLLLDEPTRGLDEDAKKKLARFLRAFAAAGNGVAFASHDVELVARVADRVVMIAGGEVVADGSPRDVIGDSNVFSPQVARVLGPDWLTVDQVIRALEQA